MVNSELELLMVMEMKIDYFLILEEQLIQHNYIYIMKLRQILFM